MNDIRKFGHVLVRATFPLCLLFAPPSWAARQATLDLASGPVTWSEQVRMNGSAGDQSELSTQQCLFFEDSRRIVGPVGVDVTCDDFTLDLRAVSPDLDHVVALQIDFSSGQYRDDKGQLTDTTDSCQMDLWIFEPGIPVESQTEHKRMRCDQGSFSPNPKQNTLLRFAAPPRGLWTFRVVCYHCKAAIYQVKAQVELVQVADAPRPIGSPHFTRVRLPGVGYQNPRLGVDSANRSYINVAQNDPNTVFRSVDDVTFTRRTHFDKDVGVYTADLRVAPDDDWVYVIGKLNASPARPEDPGPFSSVIYASPDGHNFAYAPTAVIGPGADHQALGVGPGGRVYVAATGVITPRLLVYRAVDHGKRFQMSDASLSREPPLSDVASMPTGPLVDPTNPNVVYVVYRDADADEYMSFDNWRTQLWIAKSVDGGETWKHIKITDGFLATNAQEGGAYPRAFAAAIDERGWLYVAWAQVEDGRCAEYPVPLDPDPNEVACNPDLTSPAARGETHIYISRSTNGGVDWSKRPIRVDQRPDLISNTMPAVAAGHGRVEVAWYTSGAKVAVGASSPWSLAFARSLSWNDSNGGFAESIAAKKAVHIGADCVMSVDKKWCPVHNAIDLAIGRDGRTRLVWTEDVGGGLVNYFGVETSASP
jgi:hypothetical protein